MKNPKSNLSLLLIGCILFVSCTPETQRESEETEMEAAPAEWLFFQGERNMPSIVLVSGDEEYRSEEALPQLARILSLHHGFNCTVLFAQDPEHPGVVDPNYTGNIPGLSHLDSADLMILFTRFRALPDDQMSEINDYLLEGKPVIGMRTSTHAFNFSEESDSNFIRYGNYYEGEDAWNGGFGRLVLGEKWIAHHGDHGKQSTRGFRADGTDSHPVFKGIDPEKVWGPTDVYAVRLPLPGDAETLLLGQTINRAAVRGDDEDPLLGMRPTDNELPKARTITTANGEVQTVDQNNPMMPVVWTKTYQLPGGKSGRSFTSTIGASVDLLSEDLRRMYVNAVYWLLEMPVPDSANVELVGDYKPSGFAFHDDEYWENKNLRIDEIGTP